MSFTADTTQGREENWRQWLGEFVGVKCRALEVGSYEGKSSVWFAENILTHPQSNIFCVDEWEPMEPYASRGVDMKEVYNRFRENTAAHSNIIERRGNSHDVFRCRSFAEFDFAYIDGSHWPIDVLKDAIDVFDLVRTGGIIIFDDYLWEYKGPHSTPKIAIDAFLSVYLGKYELIHKGYQVCIRKV